MARYIDADLLLTDEKTHTLPIGCGKASGNVVVFVDDSDNVFTADDIGKTVFLTREAAEKALKERSEK